MLLKQLARSTLAHCSSTVSPAARRGQVPLTRTFNTSPFVMAVETLKVASTSDFSKEVEMKEVAFKDDAKILLSKVNGQYYATGSKWCVGTSVATGDHRSRTHACILNFHPILILQHSLWRTTSQGSDHLTGKNRLVRRPPMTLALSRLLY